MDVQEAKTMAININEPVGYRVWKYGEDKWQNGFVLGFSVASFIFLIYLNLDKK